MVIGDVNEENYNYCYVFDRMNRFYFFVYIENVSLCSACNWYLSSSS